MRSFLVVSLLFFLLPAVLPAQQTQKPEELFSDAVFFYNIEDFREAAFLFQKLLAHNPENPNFNFYAGMSLLNVKGQERNAIPFFESAVTQTNIKVKKKNFKEKRAPHHAWFYLGNAYRIDNQLDKALNSYQKFRDIQNFEKHYNVRILGEEIDACSRAKIIQDSPLNLRKVNQGISLNTSLSDYNPVLSVDENTIVFVSSQRFYEAIMHAKRNGGSWSMPVNITSQIGSDGDFFPTFLTDNANTLYLVKKNKSGGDIYVSKFDGNIWSTAKPLNANINTRSDESHASLSPDERFLYFSSDRRGGFGGLDLYVSELQSDGEWGPAVNMGDVINTMEDENTPYLSKDAGTLFFASKSHFNMGGYDIFFSRKDPGGGWKNPVNIGYPINTTNDDLFFFPTGNGIEGYVALYDDEEGQGQEDIYRVEVIDLKDSSELFQNLNQSFPIELTDDDSGEITNLFNDTESNIFRVKTDNKGNNYKIKISGK